MFAGGGHSFGEQSNAILIGLYRGFRFADAIAEFADLGSGLRRMICGIA